MKQEELSEIVVKESDYTKLSELLETLTLQLQPHGLEDELARAEIVVDSNYPTDAVCLGARVEYQELVSGKTAAVDLVLPHEAEMSRGKISILSPVGSALLGLKTGGIIDWPLPDGKNARIEVINVTQKAGGAHE